MSGRTGFVVILAKCPTRRILRTPIVRIESGAGSELYRGLAAVIVVCMSVSAAFTLLLLPSLLRIGEGAKRREAEPGRAGEPVAV